MNKDFDYSTLAGAASGVIFILGMLLGNYVAREEYERNAIRHGAAHYHPETGEFVWNNQIKVENEGAGENTIKLEDIPK